MRIKLVFVSLLIISLLSSCTFDNSAVLIKKEITGKTIYPNSRIIHKTYKLSEYKNVYEKYLCYAYFMPDDGYVPDELTAVKIAKIIFERIYPDEIKVEQPLVAEFDEEYGGLFIAHLAKDLEAEVMQ